ncbi:hypothetical protein ACFLRF_05660 [Candidatus Altiarchaeota archaeon]
MVVVTLTVVVVEVVVVVLIVDVVVVMIDCDVDDIVLVVNEVDRRLLNIPTGSSPLYWTMISENAIKTRTMTIQC